VLTAFCWCCVAASAVRLRCPSSIASCGAQHRVDLSVHTQRCCPSLLSIYGAQPRLSDSPCRLHVSVQQGMGTVCPSYVWITGCSCAVVQSTCTSPAWSHTAPQQAVTCALCPVTQGNAMVDTPMASTGKNKRRCVHCPGHTARAGSRPSMTATGEPALLGALSDVCMLAVCLSQEHSHVGCWRWRWRRSCR
jgi:hypothetical protein